MTDDAYRAQPILPPGPWGPRKLGSGKGLQLPPEDPRIEDMSSWQQSTDTRLGTLEGDHRTLLQWFGGGVVLLAGAIVASFFLLSGQMRSEGEKVSTKLDTIVAQNAATQTDIAVLKERLPPKR